MWGSGPPANNPNWQPGGQQGYGAPPQSYNPQAGNPYGGAPSAPPGGNPYGGAPPGGNPYGGAPPGGNPYGGAPPGGNPYGGAPPGGNPYGAPPGGNPYGGAPPPAQYSAPGGYGAPPPGRQPPPGISPELWQWFLAVDQDQSGQITAVELQRALMNGNWKPFNEETCRLMIGMFDRNRSGTIDVQEFSALWKYIQDWKQCFERFDTDRSGNIDVREFHNALTSFGYTLSMDFAQMIVRIFDREGRGNITFDAFIQSCVMLKSYTDAFRRMDYQQQGVITIQYEQFLEMVLDNVLR